FGTLGQGLKRLADYLSEDHDLAILRQWVLQQSPEDRTQLEALVALISAAANWRSKPDGWVRAYMWIVRVPLCIASKCTGGPERGRRTTAERPHKYNGHGKAGKS